MREWVCVQKTARGWNVCSVGNLQQKTSLYYFPFDENLSQENRTDWYPIGGSGPMISRKNFWYENIIDFIIQPFQRLNAIEIRGVNPTTEALELQSKTEFHFDAATTR
jgi:hypothetical protein